MSVQQVWAETDGVIVFPSVGSSSAGSVPAGTAGRNFKRWAILDTQFENVIIFNNAGSAGAAPQPVAVSVSGGDGEFLSWKDTLEAAYRKKHLERILAKAKREERKLAKEEAKVEKKLVAQRRQDKPVEGILANYQRISLLREEKRNEIRAYEIEYVSILEFLDDDDEEDLEILSL